MMISTENAMPHSAKKSPRPVLAALTLTTLALLAPAAAQAQREHVDRFDEVLVTAGYGVAKLNWPTFSEFLASYTAANQALIRTAPTLGTGTTQSVGVAAAGCFYIGYQRTLNHLEVAFNTGARRDFELRQELVIVGVSPRFFIGKRVFLGPTASICGGEVGVRSYFTFADGTESWGKDHILNGQYGAGVFTVMAGAKAGVNLGPVLVQLKADYIPHGKGGSGLGDEPSLNKDGLPRNYDKYLLSLEDPDRYGLDAGYSAVDDAVMYDMGLVRLSVEVGIRLNPAD